MRTIKVKVYKLDELSKEVQEKVIDSWRTNNTYDMLKEDMQEELYSLLDEYGLKPDGAPKIYYSLSYSQGDGAMFEGTFEWKGLTAEVKQSGRYYHYNSKDIDLYDPKKPDEDASEKDYTAFNDLYIEICQKLERYGYGIIEAEDEERNIRELIEANDYEFYEDGRIA